jgi:hypothetical protein
MIDFWTKYIHRYLIGKRILADKKYQEAYHQQLVENQKQPSRTEIINFLLTTLSRDTRYLEIGVRNPAENFDHVLATEKYGVDPGLEQPECPADFVMTSDAFFAQLAAGKILSPEIRFDLIFIDGLHLAEQVDRDIGNAFTWLVPDGFVVLHDCNPPTEWNAREDMAFVQTPAGHGWNGTTWKAFLKWRRASGVSACCVDTDWGVGILSRHHPLGDSPPPDNPFFEYRILAEHRQQSLNLISFAELQARLT